MGLKQAIGRCFRLVIGAPQKKVSVRRSYEIQPKLITPNVVVMDGRSFRKSKVVQRQYKAAEKLCSRLARKYHG